MLFTPAQQTWIPSKAPVIPSNDMMKVMGATLMVTLGCSAAGPSSLLRAPLLCIKLFAEKTGSFG